MRTPPFFLKASLLLLGLVVASEGSLQAGCVSCGTGGECFEASQGFSANCSCVISVRRGVTLCKPQGVCDPVDPHSCDGGPWVNAPQGEQVSSMFLHRVADQDPLLSGALWGALVEDASASGELIRTRLVPGEHTGTMGKDGRSYTFTTYVRQLTQGAFSVSVLLEEDATSWTEEFEGVILERGDRGNFSRVERQGRVPVVAWKTRERQK